MIPRRGAAAPVKAVVKSEKQLKDGDILSEPTPVATQYALNGNDSNAVATNPDENS